MKVHKAILHCSADNSNIENEADHYNIKIKTIYTYIICVTLLAVYMLYGYQEYQVLGDV